MAKQRSLANGLITIEYHGGGHVEVRVTVRPEWQHPRLPIANFGPILTWSQWFLASEIERMLAAQVEVLRANAGRDYVLDDDENLVEMQDRERVVELLEAAPSKVFFTLLRSPDVIDAVIEIIAGDDSKLRRRLQKTLKRGTAARPGAPKKRNKDRRDYRTALEVAATEQRIAAAFNFVQSGRKSRDQRVYERLVEDYGFPPKVAAIIAGGRTLRMTACRLVAQKSGRTLASVRMASRRGALRSEFKRDLRK